MNELVKKENIKDLIYEIRGNQVMLDSDLAQLYECKNGTKEINQAVYRNPIKFPERFSWILTDDESKELLVTICDQKNKIDKRGGKYKNPRIFIEQGVAMLATILHTPVATEVSVALIDAFVTLRHNYIENKNNNMYIYSKLAEYDEKFEFLFSYFNINKENIYLPGQKYDAYSYIINIFKTSKRELIIIDNYADKSLLDIIRNIKSKVIIITKNKSKLSDLMINKYNSQYGNLKIIYNDSFHDRYIIVDRKTLYLSGTSFNYMGNKTFSIIQLEEESVKQVLLNKIKELV